MRKNLSLVLILVGAISMSSTSCFAVTTDNNILPRSDFINRWTGLDTWRTSAIDAGMSGTAEGLAADETLQSVVDTAVTMEAFKSVAKAVEQTGDYTAADLALYWSLCDKMGADDSLEGEAPCCIAAADKHSSQPGCTTWSTTSKDAEGRLDFAKRMCETHPQSDYCPAAQAMENISGMHETQKKQQLLASARRLEGWTWSDTASVIPTRFGDVSGLSNVQLACDKLMENGDITSDDRAAASFAYVAAHQWLKTDDGQAAIQAAAQRQGIPLDEVQGWYDSEQAARSVAYAATGGLLSDFVQYETDILAEIRAKIEREANEKRKQLLSDVMSELDAIRNNNSGQMDCKGVECYKVYDAGNEKGKSVTGNKYLGTYIDIR